MNVLVWNEFLHEKRDEAVRSIYPDGIHAAIAGQIRTGLPEAVIGTATLDQPEHGLTAARLDTVDVLIWWGHLGHDLVDNAVVRRVQDRVLQGMGLIVLHSAHLSKIFTRLMGTTCNLRWREAEDRELIWCVAPTHPIAQGIRQPIQLPGHEMYGEYFDIPVPDELVFVSNFSGGEVFRSGCCFHRGKGRVFYFSPGHETYPIYHQPQIGRVLCNAVRWAHQAQLAEVETRHSPQSPTGWFIAPGAD
ncbi:MAG: ThuA domain-containing protein [Pseudomonadales bacterium]